MTDIVAQIWTPREVGAVDMAFPTSVGDYLPPMEMLPDDFRKLRQGNRYVKTVETWFFSGLEKSKLTAKDGVDRNLALRHLQYVLGSFEPKHEHKIAGVAYLMSLWFDLKD